MKLLPHLIDIWNPIRYRNTFNNLECFCMFVGYPRSGHSIIGAMLDAHPEMIISHEVHVLKMLKEGNSKWRIFLEILNRSRKQASEGRIQNIYSYKINQQYQGKHTTLKVIGDKKGGGSALLLANHPRLIDELQRTVNLPIKIIHITRNPFDAISTSLIRRHEKRGKYFSKNQLIQEIDEFFIKAESIKILKNKGIFEIFEMKQEIFIVDSKIQLKNICNFLGLGAPEDYLDACSDIVNPKLNKSRHNVDFWDKKLINSTISKMQEYDFFHSYTFNT